MQRQHEPLQSVMDDFARDEVVSGSPAARHLSVQPQHDGMEIDGEDASSGKGKPRSSAPIDMMQSGTPNASTTPCAHGWWPMIQGAMPTLHP
jgi:hypothetical protein